MKKWGDQKWRTKSGKKSSKTGERYLPDKAIKALSDKEYKKTSAKKRKDMKKGKQFSKQPKKIAKKTAKYRSESLSGRDMSYCKCGTKDQVKGFTCGQHCDRVSKKTELFTPTLLTAQVKNLVTLLAVFTPMKILPIRFL